MIMNGVTAIGGALELRGIGCSRLSIVGFVAALGLFMAAVAGAQDATMAASQLKGTVQGRLLHGDTGAPLENAFASFVNEGTGPKGVFATTNEYGIFQLQLPAGSYDVTLSYLLYPDKKLSGFVVKPGEIVRLEESISTRVEVDFRAHVVAFEDAPAEGKEAAARPVEVVSSANVMFRPIDGTTKVYGAVSGEDGRFTLRLPVGEYEVTAMAVFYQKLVIPRVVVRNGENPTLRIRMTPQKVTTKEILVQGNTIRNTAVSEIQTRRKAGTVSDGISRQEITKSSDSDAGQVLNRVTGLSVKDGRYLIVRGLSERYASTQLNGARIGSPEPNRKVVPLDIFPSGLLDNITVQKAYSPDQPGEFGGGTVQIRTREVPDQPIWGQSIGAGFNSGSAGRTGLGYRGGTLDFLGMDDGSRNLPDIVKEMASERKIVQKSPLNPDSPGFTKDEFLKLARSFGDQWSPVEKDTPLNSSYSGAFGRRFEWLGKPVGVVAGYSYSANAGTTTGERNFYEDVSLQTKGLYDETKSTRSVLWGGTGTLTMRLSEGTTLKGGLFYSRSSDDEARRYQGFSADLDQNLRSERLLFVERSLGAGTIGAEHKLPLLNAKLEWKLNRSRAFRSEPDRREHTFEEIEILNEETGEVDSTFWRFSGRVQASRLFSQVDDDEQGVEGHITIPFKSWATGNAHVKFGGLNQQKDRTSWTRRFTFRQNSGDNTAPADSILQDANIGTQIQFFDNTRGTDYYWADQSLHAWYAMVEMPLTARLRFLAGVRTEKAVQSVGTFSGEIFASDLEHFGNDDTDLMPALNLTQALGPDMNLRFAASQTVSRPDLRELTDYDMSNYFSGANETGNPELRRALLQSYDFRWEAFPSLGELVSVSLFYKKLKGPIEKTLQGGESPRIFPANGKNGRNLGVEFELRTGLGRLWQPLTRFGLNTNLTLVNSEIEVPAIGVETAKVRPLEGQSPYVFNLALFYTSKGGGTELSAFYNWYGRRLQGVGIQGQPDIYEREQKTLDLVAARKLSRKLKLKLAAKNLTGEQPTVEQGGRIRERYEPGVSWSMGLSIGS
jgi:hypothetical protein